MMHRKINNTLQRFSHQPFRKNTKYKSQNKSNKRKKPLEHLATTSDQVICSTQQIQNQVQHKVRTRHAHTKLSH